MNSDDFEKHLQSRPLRRLPDEWRAEILRSAKASTHNPALKTRSLSWLSTLLWPNPKAWAGLGAVWILIIGLQFAARDAAPRMAKSSAFASPELVAQLKDQERMLAELVGNNEPRPAAKPARFPAEPRSERREDQFNV